MAQAKLNIQGGSNYSFVVREISETIGNRFLSYNSLSGIILFNEVQDGQLHNYRVTVSSDGCLSASQIIPFKCTAYGSCENINQGVIQGSYIVEPNTPLYLQVVNLYGTTPYTYSWSAPGGVLSSTNTQSTTVTYTSIGTYTVQATISNCGETPVIITASISVVANACSKDTGLCYFYGLNNTSSYSTLSEAQAAACLNTSNYSLGNFSNGLNIGSDVFVNVDAGSCTKLSPGFYPVKSSSNGCNPSSAPQALINTVIQISVEGKIISTNTIACDINFTLSTLQQPVCSSNALTNALVTFSSIVNSNAYKYNVGSTFDNSGLEHTFSTSSTVVELPPAIPGQTLVYTIRFYNTGNPSKFKDVNVSITSPTGCSIQTPVPILMGAEVQTSNTITLQGLAPCAGELKIYGRDPSSLNYELLLTQNVSVNQFSINFAWTGLPDIELPGREIAVTLNCPMYGVVSELSDPTISYVPQ